MQVERRFALIADEMGMEPVRLLDEREMLRLSRSETALREYDVSERESFRNCDLMIEADSPDEGECYIAVQVSYTVDHGDIDRAIDHAEMMTRITGKPAHSAVAGAGRSGVTESRMESGSVHCIGFRFASSTHANSQPVPESPMSYENLLLSQEGHVLTITVNRPEVRNAQSRMMLEEFDDALLGAADDDSVRVVIVAGAGDHFSSGHDLGSPQEMADRERRPYPDGIPGRVRAQLEPEHRQHHALARLPQADHRAGSGILHHGRPDSRHRLRHDSCRR